MKYLKSKPGSLEAAAGQVSSFATEQEYQKMFKKELDKAGKGIASMSDQEKKNFFNKIDKMYKAKNEITAAQKKLPPALQKAIKDKEQKEELDKDDTSAVKKVKDMLKKASQAHAGQAKELDKALKEKDSYGNEINKAKHAAYKDPKAGEHKPVDPKPSLKSVAKTVKEMMKKKKDDVATMADTEKDKEAKKTTLVGSKKTPVDLKPEVEYKN
tara:strand:+ start:300 stop:938 length:639 start_codon:yes stop_codon:yes gene_type:complete